jgi:alkylation response protein AidB-like acyl-CoA dehydrogenase
MWNRFAALGLPAIGLPEAHGGIGGAAELAIAFEAFGRAMALEPLLASTVLAGTAIARAGSAGQAARLLPAIADGTLRGALAHAEAGAGHAPCWVETRAVAQGGGWRLHGRKRAVLHGNSAGLLVVSARDADGIGLFLVEPGAAGLRRDGARLQDGTPIADLMLDDAAGERLDGAGWPAIEAALQAGLVSVLAASAGAMAAALDLTVEYLKTRRQFGRAIGSNQALQHRAAEMRVMLEEARSMTQLAAFSLEEPDAQRRADDLSRARVIVSRAARFIGQQTVQLHGGIGMTEEYAAGHYLRYLTVAGQMFGDEAWHLVRLEARIEGWA